MSVCTCSLRRTLTIAPSVACERATLPWENSCFEDMKLHYTSEDVFYRSLRANVFLGDVLFISAAISLMLTGSSALR